MWRIGRYIYCKARGIVTNNIATNGERYVQACVLEGGDNLEAQLTIFDVGANLGEWTRSFLLQASSLHHSAIRVLMFEPIPSTFKKLEANIKNLENGEKAKAHKFAFSNEVGEAEMVVLSETGGTNSLEFDNKMSGSALDRIKIKKTTLDDYCKNNNIEHIHLLKCDTEGHDAHAVMGAQGMLQAQRIDVIQFEYNHRWVYARSYLKDMFDLIEDLPYRIGRVCPNSIELYEGWHFELDRFFEDNYIIIHERALSWFNIKEGVFDQSNTYA